MVHLCAGVRCASRSRGLKEEAGRRAWRECAEQLCLLFFVRGGVDALLLLCGVLEALPVHDTVHATTRAVRSDAHRAAVLAAADACGAQWKQLAVAVAARLPAATRDAAAAATRGIATAADAVLRYSYYSPGKTPLPFIRRLRSSVLDDATHPVWFLHCRAAPYTNGDVAGAKKRYLEPAAAAAPAGSDATAGPDLSIRLPPVATEAPAAGPVAEGGERVGVADGAVGVVEDMKEALLRVATGGGSAPPGEMRPDIDDIIALLHGAGGASGAAPGSAACTAGQMRAVAAAAGRRRQLPALASLLGSAAVACSPRPATTLVSRAPYGLRNVAGSGGGASGNAASLPEVRRVPSALRRCQSPTIVTRARRAAAAVVPPQRTPLLELPPQSLLCPAATRCLGSPALPRRKKRARMLPQRGH